MNGVASSPSDSSALASRQQLPESEWSLIDWYLEQQGRLSAVEEFTRVHEQLKAPVYRALLPATPPGPGEQYAFEVDLDRCSGCKACVTACHSLNGLDDKETWRDVGLLIGGGDERPFQQHITTACHHCLEPACMDVCPTLAYEKDSQTGIVKHLDDQCFGCQYCILACPYNVPRYNSRLGIVRKCDLCSQRLKAGEAPACVQACPHEAIRIQIVDNAQIQADAESSHFLPGTPDPQYTLPTTNYRTERPWPRNLMPADYFRVETEHAHRPLVAMLVLTQMAVGGFLTMAMAEGWNRHAAAKPAASVHELVSLAACYLGLTASLLHLGRPWLAYRAILGLRTSWLSREILAFGVFAGAATWLTAQTWSLLPDRFDFVPRPVVLWLTAALGAIGVFCSAMIYHRTKRPFWNLLQSGSRFALTTLLLGLAIAWISAAVHQRGIPGNGWNARAILSCISVIGLVKGLLELGAFLPLTDRGQTPLKRSALLLAGPLCRVVLLRFSLLIICGIAIPGFGLLASGDEERSLVAALACPAGLTWGEMLERSLFFKASVAFRMPGGPSA